MLAQIEWDLFFTLTFDPRRGDVDRRRAEAEAQWWLRVVSKIVRYDLGWTVTTERHASGSWHVHGLVKGLNSNDAKLARGIWRRRHGTACIEPVTDQARAAEYVTKYSYATNDILISDNMARHLRAAAVLPPESPEPESRHGERSVGRSRTRRPVGSMNSAAALGEGDAKPQPPSALSPNMPADLEPADLMAGATATEGPASVIPERTQVAGCGDGRAAAVVADPGADDAVGGERTPGASRLCAGCGREFTPRRPTKRCCRDACRARLSHAKRREALRLVQEAIGRGDLVDAGVRLTKVLDGR